MKVLEFIDAPPSDTFIVKASVSVDADDNDYVNASFTLSDLHNRSVKFSCYGDSSRALEKGANTALAIVALLTQYANALQILAAERK